MVEKIKPDTRIEQTRDNDGWNYWYEIRYFCPVCNKRLQGYRKENGCENCGTFFDWGSKEPKIKITREVEW